MESKDVMVKENVQLASLENMSLEEKEKINEIVESIDVTDSAAVLQYGIQAQSNVSSFADEILNRVRTKDSGYVGENLTELMNNIKGMEVDELGKKSFFGLFGGLKKSAEKFVTKYEKLSVHLDRTIKELDKSKMQLLKDVNMLDELYDKNLQYHRELEYYIVAGEKKIIDLKDTVLPKLSEEANISGDPVDAQKVNDYGQLINRFEKKVHDLKLSKTISLQTGPQIRLIQNSDQVLVEKIQSSILNTIPLWKNQMVIAISLMRQEKALKQQQEVNKTTNDLLTKNSEMLKQNTLEIAEESEKGIVEIESLKKVNQDLIDTIEETIHIQREGSAKRAQAEEDLKEMELQLKKTLMSVNENRR